MAKIKELQVKEEPAATLGRNEIESALAKIEEVQALLSKYSDKLAARQLHTGSIAQLKSELRDISRKVSTYAGR